MFYNQWSYRSLSCVVKWNGRAEKSKWNENIPSKYPSKSNEKQLIEIHRKPTHKENAQQFTNRNRYRLWMFVCVFRSFVFIFSHDRSTFALSSSYSFSSWRWSLSSIVECSIRVYFCCIRSTLSGAYCCFAFVWRLFSLGTLCCHSLSLFYIQNK